MFHIVSRYRNKTIYCHIVANTGVRVGVGVGVGIGVGVYIARGKAFGESSWRKLSAREYTRFFHEFETPGNKS